MGTTELEGGLSFHTCLSISRKRYGMDLDKSYSNDLQRDKQQLIYFL